MKNMVSLYQGIGHTRVKGEWEERDGKHYCVWCNKMLKIGQIVISDGLPEAHYRRTKYTYRHKVCPVKP